MSRDYPENGYPSVTEVLNVLRKHGLEMWFKLNTIQFCNEESKKGKLIGTQIHDAIESYIRTGKAKVESEYGDEVVNALNSFMLFRKEHPEITPEIAELSLSSDKYGFNGTIDCVAGNLILDWKSSNAKERKTPKIYDEWIYQVAAYSHLYHENEGGGIKDAIIVAICKDKVAYNMRKIEEYEVIEAFNKVFLPALSICNYQRRKK